MKFKIINLGLLISLLCTGLNINSVNAAEIHGDTRILDLDRAGSIALCNDGQPTDTCTSEFGDTICTPLCAALQQAKGMILSTLCKDPAVQGSSNANCQNLCGATGTLSDLACCLKAEGSKVEWKTDGAISTVCGVFSAAQKTVGACEKVQLLATYGQYMCCELGLTKTAIGPCLSGANMSCSFTPDPACAASTKK